MDLKNLEYTHHDESDDVSRQGSKVELFIRCENLADLDIFSKSDPICVLFIKQLGQWREMARTEAVDDTYDPSFVDTFILDFAQEEGAKLKFAIYDTDSRSSDLCRQDFVGSVETTLGSLTRRSENITENFFTLRVPGNPQRRGEIFITSEFVKPTRSKVHLQLGANLLSQNLVSRVLKTRNSVLEVRRSMSQTKFHPVLRSEAVEKSTDPRWRPFTLSVQKLCNGDPDRQMEIAILRMESRKPEKDARVNSYRLIGSVTTTLRQIISATEKSDLPLTKFKNGEKGKPKAKGSLRVLRKSMDMAYTLMDYVKGGCSLKLIVAIDFTLSNGTLENGTSLHQLGEIDNEYMDVIKSLGSVLCNYDFQQHIPAFGFGAKMKSSSTKTKHCFSLNGSSTDPFCVGIKGVLESYKRMARKLTFSGPSKLAPVLKEATKLASMVPVTQENQHYSVCLIITDGVVNDLDDTIAALADSSKAPLSVVIVGVGPADFPTMELFTSNSEGLPFSQSARHKPCRPNTHFTSLRRDRQALGMNAALIRESVGQVSTQMVKYFSENLIAPGAPIHATQNTQIGNWMDDSTDSLHNGSMLDFSTPHSTQNGLSRIKSKPLGPICPTCGSDIEATCDPVLNLNPGLR